MSYPMLTKILPLVVLVISLFAPTIATADYEIEVIVFLNNTDDRLEETPMKMSALPTFSDSTPASSMGLPEGFTALPETAFKMTKQYARLERSGRYTPVIHFGWQQPDLRETQRKALQLSAPQTNGLSIDGTMALYRTPQDLIIESNMFAIQQVGGFTPSVTDTDENTNETDIFLGQPEIQPSRTPASWQAWRTKEKRDVSSLSRLQYFDNPAFGILVRLRKIASAAASNTSTSVPPAEPAPALSPVQQAPTQEALTDPETVE